MTHHTKKTANSNSKSVYAALLRKYNASVNNEGNVYYPARENFNNNNHPTRGNLLKGLMRAPTRRNYLLRQAKPQLQNEASALRKMLINIRARLRGTGRNLTK